MPRARSTTAAAIPRKTRKTTRPRIPVRRRPRARSYADTVPALPRRAAPGVAGARRRRRGGAPCGGRRPPRLLAVAGPGPAADRHASSCPVLVGREPDPLARLLAAASLELVLEDDGRRLPVDPGPVRRATDGTRRSARPAATGGPDARFGDVARQPLVAQTDHEARLLRDGGRPLSRGDRHRALGAAHVEGQPHDHLVDAVGRGDAGEGIRVRGHRAAAPQRGQRPRPLLARLGNGEPDPARPEVDAQESRHGAGTPSAARSGREAPWPTPVLVPRRDQASARARASAPPAARPRRRSRAGRPTR